MIRLRPLRLPTILLAMLLVLPQFTLGAVPQLLNFQGVLKNNGVPVPNGSHTITFAIYDAPSGGTVLWTETQSVTTNTGHFAVLLGSVTPIPNNVLKGTNKYLGITVPPDPELSPRQQLVSVASSYQVGTIDGATGGAIAGSVHLGAGDTLFATNVSSNSPLRLQTAGTTRVYVDDATGNVGVGTSSPLYPLDVQRGGSVATGLLRAKQSDLGGGQLNVVGFGADLGSAQAGDVLITNDMGGMWIAPNAPGKFLRLTGGMWTNPSAMLIDQDGRVYVGATLTVSGAASVSNDLTVVGNGDVAGKLCVGGEIRALGPVLAFVNCSPSDSRHKTAVVPMEHVLEKVMDLHAVNYQWNDQFKITHPQAAGKQIGVIAQELESEFPELVYTGEDGYKNVDYGKLSAVLLEAIKEQQKQIERLNEAVEKLQHEHK